MSRFNSPTVAPKRVKVPSVQTAGGTAPKLQPASPTTVNLAGGEAYGLSLRGEIVTTLLNSMLKGSAYESSDGELSRLQSLADRAEAAGETEFLAKAALYARHVHGLRSVSHVIAGELGERARGAAWKRAFYRHIVFRPDDLTEILAYWSARHQGFRHPNAMLRGFADRLVQLNAYQIAKYKGDGKPVSMVDAVNLCHPKAPKDHPIHDLMKGKLAAAETWETALSKAGNAETDEAVTEAKGEAWIKLLSENKLGYLACLRNLRNIAEQAPQALSLAIQLIVNPTAIAKAKIFPFQFRMAYDVLRESSLDNGVKHTLAHALAQAMELAIANCPKFEGKTLVVVDDSGSMSGDPIRIAALFAATMLKANVAADYMQFSNNARYLNVDTVGMSIFAMATAIIGSAANGGTNFVDTFRVARPGYDRIIILSDMQGWMEGGVQEAFIDYAKRSGKTPFLYSFDLNGKGTSQFPERQVCLMAGFSDKVFDIMGRVESDPQALINEIAEVDLVKGIQKQAAQ